MNKQEQLSVLKKFVKVCCEVFGHEAIIESYNDWSKQNCKNQEDLILLTNDKENVVIILNDDEYIMSYLKINNDISVFEETTKRWMVEYNIVGE